MLQFTIPGPDIAEKIFECRRTFICNSVTPLFGFAKYFLCDPVVAPKSLEGGANRFGIYLSHQLTDKLLLPAQRAARLHPLCSLYRLQELVIKFDLCQLLGIQINQTLAQGLQSQVFAFPRALAGFGQGHKANEIDTDSFRHSIMRAG